MYLSHYQTAGFEADNRPPASLTPDMIRRVDDSKIIRFGGRAHVGGAVQTSSVRKRKLAQFRAILMSPNVRLFMTTSSSTFAFVLGFLS